MTSERPGKNKKRPPNYYYLEITANKRFSNKLKAEIPRDREIIFRFLKEATPDITGFIKKDFSSDFLVIEVKKEEIQLDDIYQLKKYKDLFNAKFAFLVSTEPIPEKIKRVLKVISPLCLSIYETLDLVHFNITALEHIRANLPGERVLAEDLFTD